MKNTKYYMTLFLKWLLLGSLIGCLGGLLGTAFHYALRCVTKIRSDHTWVIFLLPIGGLLTLGIYRLFRIHDNRGTNEIIDAILDGRPIKTQIAPAIFLSSCITHLFGGSAGREGAALQLGGSSASLLAKLFRLDEDDRTILIMSGMSAVFAGLFGTPLTAALFAMEFESVGTIFSPAVLPCYLAAYAASLVSGFFGVHAETAVIGTFELTFFNFCQIGLLVVGVSFLSSFMCWLFQTVEHISAKGIPNRWLRIAIGGALITAATLLVGDQRYNGAGMEMALLAINGSADWYDFLLKMLFTAVTLGAGFKGGEIIPTFCIGATFGCLYGGLLGLDPGISAALCLIGLFCCATNSPLASIVLSIEMFGGQNLHIFALVSVFCFVISGDCGLYASQIHPFIKSNLSLVRNRNPEEYSKLPTETDDEKRA